MPSIALVTQAAPGNSSATATIVQDYTALAGGTTSTSNILQVQALPRLFFYINVTAGGPITLQPEFAVRGDTTTQGPGLFTPAPNFLPLGPDTIHAGAGSPPLILDFEMPSVYIRLKTLTDANAPASTYTIILAASV
jgi:hypothetical protein